ARRAAVLAQISTRLRKTGDFRGPAVAEAFPWDTAPLSAAGPRKIVWSGIPLSSSSDGDHGGHHCPAITLAKSLRRASHRSIRRDCLDHVIILNERHLGRVLSSYFQYHHDARTHLSLNKDCPRPRRVQLP